MSNLNRITVVFFGIILFISAGVAFGQHNLAKIHLKDGSIIRGIIVENEIDDYIKVMVLDTQQVVISYDKIKRFRSVSFKYNAFTSKQTGYFNETSTGLIFLKSSEFSGVSPDWTLHTVNGVWIRRGIRAGLGLGFDRYGETSALPIYISGRGDIGSGRVVPVMNLNLGYAPMWVKSSNSEWTNIDDVKGGMYWEIGSGIKIKGINSSLTLNLAYKHQSGKLTYENVWWWNGSGNVSVEKRNFRNIAFTVGMAF